VPLFGTLIGLEIEGTVHVGVCHLPVLHETVAAATGHGCWFNLRRAHVSTVDTLEAATLVCSDIRTAGRRLAGQWVVMEARTALQRTWGDCYGHCLVATGRADIMLDPVMNPWDCAPFVPILQEAGGRFTDWRGDVRIDGGDAVSTNGLLHPHVLELLAAAAHEVR
jgi:histidinol-phosphatase